MSKNFSNPLEQRFCPSALPDNLPWCGKPFEPEEPFDPYVYDGNMAPEDYQLMWRHKDATRIREEGTYNMTVSTNIKSMREAAGLTIAQLAERSCININTVSALESGAEQVISSKALLRLARTLGATVDQLLVDEVDDEQATEHRTVQTDDIYPVLRDAELAGYVMSSLMDQFFSDELECTREGFERLAVSFTNAQPKAEILLDYVHRVVCALRELYATVAAAERDIHSTSITMNDVITEGI